MNDVDMMVKTVVSRRKLNSIISKDDGEIDGIEYKKIFFWQNKSC